MRIMSTGDFHGDKNLVKKLADKAEKEEVDLVLICGDLTHQDKDHKGLIGPFLEKHKKVLFVGGNHDSTATLEVLKQKYGYQAKHINGYGLKYDDIGIFGCGGANIGWEALEEEEIFATLEEGHKGVSYLDKKIMVTHVHPTGIVAEKFTKFFPGSSGVRKAIEKIQPDFAFCCHVHEAEGLEEQVGKTKVVNVGKRGFIFDL